MRLFLGAFCAATAATTALSYGTGVWPGLVGWSGTVNLEVTRSLSATNGACGECHNIFPGGGPTPLRVFVEVSQRVLRPNDSITVTTWSMGGQITQPPLVDVGGLCMDATAGTFTAGSNTQTDPTGTAITHQFASLSNGRRWVYGYNAPAQPGLVELFCAINTADGDGQPTGDVWAFHGSNPFSPFSTPVRLYVLAPGVQVLGSSCRDGYGNFPVLGAQQTPLAGNQAFGLELHGAAPNALAFFLLAFNGPNFTPLDLGVIGITGCTAEVENPIVLAMVTTGGMPELGEGTVALSWPIPNIPGLQGTVVQAQAAFLDGRATAIGRTVPLTFTNGLSITVQ